MTGGHEEPPSAAEAEPLSLVVDASVAVKWLLRDEALVAEASFLLEEHVAGRLALAAPQQIEVEVTAAIRRAMLGGRVDTSGARQLLDQWLDELCPSLALVPNARLLAAAFEFSVAQGVTLFDALYLTLAQAAGLDAVVADQRLLRSPAARLPFVLSLAAWHSRQAVSDADDER